MSLSLLLQINRAFILARVHLFYLVLQINRAYSVSYIFAFYGKKYPGSNLQKDDYFLKKIQNLPSFYLMSSIEQNSMFSLMPYLENCPFFSL